MPCGCGRFARELDKEDVVCMVSPVIGRFVQAEGICSPGRSGKEGWRTKLSLGSLQACDCSMVWNTARNLVRRQECAVTLLVLQG